MLWHFYDLKLIARMILKYAFYNRTFAKHCVYTRIYKKKSYLTLKDKDLIWSKIYEVHLMYGLNCVKVGETVLQTCAQY